MHLALLYILFLSLPLQTRTLLFAGANEYQSGFLYLSDIIAGFLFLYWLSRKPQKSPFLIPSLFFIGWLTISSALSQNPFAGLYHTLKIAEYLWIAYYVSTLSLKYIRHGAIAFVGGGVLQSILGIAQFFFQHDLGLRFLGENVLNPQLAGVAKIDAAQKMIRAYGTLPHPNVLAAFIVICMLVLFWLMRMYPPVSKKHLRLYYCAISILALGLIVTFARIAIITFVGALCVWLWHSTRERKAIISALSILCILGLIFLPFLISRTPISAQDQSISFRLVYIKNALRAIATHPFIGVGLAQFTHFQEPLLAQKSLPAYANQPVHNIYLLLMAETGLIGFLFFCWLVYTLFSPLYQTSWRKHLLILLLPICLSILGLFDHFFISYQQGALLFWISLAFYYAWFRMET